ncbi:phosphoribosyltransferase [Leptolyngbya sp. NK1-12]|uniref:Phosphoribosyltransferase n=1 Tax=Leptolyngbya sp. NK1-12 TaxID=2547451 RepID=A0AA97AF27_9CYAN|nr:phosphoribosyltransferase [Leptolyngbya sp. NK1-12]WNZ21854.1 phosphoribosyltransferase [Leptolyngbya sp. NK1-12]
MNSKFHDRAEAGKLLAAKLANYADRSGALVLALPRGGVPVGFEIAQTLNLPLDICLVRKLGVPGQEELAMGAIAPDGIMVLNNDVLRSMKISRQALLEVASREKQELDRRMQAYRGDRPIPQIRDRLIILVDDGIATSSTLRAAITALQKQHPQGIVVAAPVAPATVCEALKNLVQDVVCLATPEPLYSIGMWYKDFSQTTDEEVCRLLKQAAENQAECSLG